MIIAEYIWIGGKDELRSKTKTYHPSIVKKMDLRENYLNSHNYPLWNYDGSSTEQAVGNDSEVIIKPVAVFDDPFNIKNRITMTSNFEKVIYVLVLCETYTPDNKPLPNNHRHKAVELFRQKRDTHPWYGIEQEFYILKKQYTDKKMLHKFSTYSALGSYQAEYEPQGRYYCSVGGTVAFGRDCTSEAYQMCIAAGVKVSGMNAEVGPGQWEIQVGPCEGIESGDHMMMLRYILQRVSENYGVEIVFDPKPLTGDWNGSGCHTNFSTKQMREGNGLTEDEAAVQKRKGEEVRAKSGMDFIMEGIQRLSEKHEEHMMVYGQDNEQRMTGLHETADYDTFTYGVADRSASIRIPRETEKNQRGYLEDRRPGSNMDPYLVTGKIYETVVLND